MELLRDGPADGRTLVLAHGAGAAMDSAWMNGFCGLLWGLGIQTVRFEFDYMAGRRAGVRKPPPRAELVTDEYRAVIASLDRPLVIGGKSYGGRVASLIADESRVAGLVCLGYPFHPPERPEQQRTAHLRELATPTLICQGTRDPLGSREEVATYELSPTIDIHWLDDGEHDFTPRKAISGRTRAQNLAEAATAVAEFVAAHSG